MEDQLQFTPEMKKMFILSMLIPLAMICSCQKQDSAAERQLAQRKTELDAREQTLGEKEKELALRETVLNERERALAEKEKALANGRTIPTLPNLQSRPISPDGQSRDPRDQLRDPARLKADRERLIQQLPPQFKSLLNPPDVSEMRERLQRTRQAQMQNNGAIPATTAAPGAVYPSAEATSPSPSPTPQ
jgi:hypothetical protein